MPRCLRREIDRNLLAGMLDDVDSAGLKVTWVELPRSWRCVVTPLDPGVSMPPHDARGRTPLAALAEVMRFFRRIGGCR